MANDGVPDRVPLLARVTPEGRAPVSLKAIGVSPLAVTEKVPALFSLKVADAADVNTGAEVLTFRVKDWVVVGVVDVGGGDGDRVDARR